MGLFTPKREVVFQASNFKIVKKSGKENEDKMTIIYGGKREEDIDSYKQVDDRYIVISSGKTNWLFDTTAEKKIEKIQAVNLYADGAVITEEGGYFKWLLVDGKLSESFNNIVAPGYNEQEKTFSQSNESIFHFGQAFVCENDKYFYIDKEFKPVDNQKIPVEYAGSGNFALGLRRDTVAYAHGHFPGVFDYKGNYSAEGDTEFDFIQGKVVAGETSSEEGYSWINKFPNGEITSYYKDLMGNVIEKENVTDEFKMKAKALYDYANKMKKVNEIPVEFLADEKFVSAVRRFAMKNAYENVLVGGESIFTDLLKFDPKDMEDLRNLMYEMQQVIGLQGKDAFFAIAGKKFQLTEQEAEKIYQLYTSDVNEIEKMREDDIENEI